MKPAPTYKFLPADLAERLRSLGLAVRQPVEGALQGLHRSPRHGSSVEFADYREYARGDAPDLIDWAVYARSDRYVIRRYQEETNLRACLMLDTSESMAFSEAGTCSKMDYASFLAAGLMYILINQGDSAGLMLFNQGVGKSFDPVRSWEGLRPMLLALEAVKPLGRSDIEAVLHQVAELVHARTLVVLISDLMQEPAAVLRGLRHLRHNHHEVRILHVLDGSELRLSFNGLVELKELETGSRLVVQAEEIREAYQQAVEDYLAELRRGCADCLADYRLVETRTPVEKALYFPINRS